MESITPLNTTKIANIKLSLRKIDEALETLKDAFKIENLSENQIAMLSHIVDLCREEMEGFDSLPFKKKIVAMSHFSVHCAAVVLNLLHRISTERMDKVMAEMKDVFEESGLIDPSGKVFLVARS